MAQDNCCTRCTAFIVTIGLTALFLWLSMRVDEPHLYLEKIYVPALNKTLNPSPGNTTILFTVRLVNGNKDNGIKYDDVHLTFKVFVSNNTTRPLGNATVDRFYQGHNKKAFKHGSLNGGGNLTVTVSGKVVYRVDFTTAIKYKIVWWYTKRHLLWGGVNVEMNDSGLKVNRKPVRLGGKNPEVIPSSAPESRGCYRALVTFFVAAFVLLLDAHRFS
ncbi:protein NDR1-like [Vigna umbellata]|uniref:protein NDR1-like n=1 Tax=Vigna umbellata TaxID=87088 RepID=UPI001F5EB24C|nr:protein NDR1-like [Vigna umbellata]